MLLVDGDTPCAAHFDATLDAWVLSQYADVLAALRAPALVMPGTGALHDSAHSAVRDAVTQAWTTDKLASWRVEMEADAVRRVDALPAGETVDLVHALAQPWSLGLALLATGAPRTGADRCANLASELFLSAASATTGSPHAAAQDAAIELSRLLGAANTLGDTGASVQAFVALSQTLPSLLATTWFVLLHDPAAQAAVRAQTHEASPLPRRTLNELLRTAGPARAVFREALEDTLVAGMRVPAGDRVVLQLTSANHDAEHFGDPTRVDCTRENAAHLAFGAGAHACAGSALVRMALDVATGALLRGTSLIELDTTVPLNWIGGFAIRAPGMLPARLFRASVAETGNPSNP